jgi:DNA end-binding protein Ku
MAARAIWKADLTLGELRLPVKLYAAVTDAKVHFRLLHAKDSTPVTQRMVDPETQEPVPPEQIRRAVQVDRGVFVTLTPEEQAELEPKASRAITVERVVPAGELDERWFHRPYYLGPDGDDDSYFALAETLEDKNQIAIAHWVMRKKSYAGALYGSGGYLLLDTLRNATEVIDVEAVRVPPGRKPDAREIKLAQQLIGTLEDEFDATRYRDEHRAQVLAFVEAKAKGKVVRFPKAAGRKPSDSLVKDLQASLKAGKRANSGR